MKLVRLGHSNLQVPRVAVGCWQLSPQFWGSIDLDPWQRALDASLERGVNFMDTANAYGEGYAEEQFGKYLQSRGTRDQWIIATKFYWDFWTPLPGSFSMKRTISTSRQEILRACEDSLRRLGVEQIDLYQLHSWDPLIRPEELGLAINELKLAGKIRAFGVSNLNAEQMRLLAPHVQIDTLQPKYNLLHRGPEEREFPYCQDQRISTLLYSPLERGLLSGKVTAESRFDDARGKSGYFLPANLPANVEVLTRLSNLAGELGLTLPQFAIRWVLTHPAATVALIGTKKPEHILSLLETELEPLPSIYWHEAAQIAKGLRS